MGTKLAPRMSACVAGRSVTFAPVSSGLNRPSSPSLVNGVGRTGGAAATFSPNSSNSEPHWPPGRADDLVVGALLADVFVRGDRDQHGNADCFRKRLRLARAIVLVDEDAGHADIAAHLAEILDRLADVVRHIKRLQIVRSDDDHLLAHVARDRQAEAAADHVAEEIEQDVIETPVVEAQLLEQFEPVDDPAPTAAAPDLGAAQLHREHAVALEAHILDADLFARQLLLGRSLDDRGAGFAPEQQAGRVRFRIAADQQHALALLRHHVAEVRQGERLARAALAVDRDDLRFFGHFAGVYGIGFDRGFGAQRPVEKIAKARAIGGERGAGQQVEAHCTPLQSRTILRQAASVNATG